MFAMPRYRCAILDDYQNVALNAADWSKVAGDLDIKVFNAHIDGQDKVVKALQGFEIVCAMRERTAFPRGVIEKLPELKLLVTTGLRNASIDVAAANERGVVVCGTPSVGNPTSAIAIGLMLELTRHIGYENARMKAGVPWQTTIGMDLEGLTLGVLGLGKLGTRTAKIAQAFGVKVIAWSQNLTAEKCKEVGVGYVSKEELFRQADFITIHVVLSQRTRGLIWREGARADEAVGLHHQYLARSDYRGSGAAGRATGEQDRRRRARRVRRRAAARRASATQDEQRRAHAASRLRGDAELSRLFWRRGRRHPGFPRRQAGARDRVTLTGAGVG
jgi:D-isomer specific 2-hydroxyacid dehydrogenase, NAD binding domain/D-isomer specific 2-hydroxyacid dehydrogenase, catalytic domain